MEYKICVLFFSTTFEIFFILRRLQRHTIKMYRGIILRYLLFLSVFKEFMLSTFIRKEIRGTALYFKPCISYPLHTNSNWVNPIGRAVKGWVCGKCVAGFVVRVPREELMSVCWEYCVMSGTGPYVGLITRPEES